MSTMTGWVHNLRQASPALRRYVLKTMWLAAVSHLLLPVAELAERFDRWHRRFGIYIDARDEGMRRRFRDEQEAKR